MQHSDRESSTDSVESELRYDELQNLKVSVMMFSKWVQLFEGDLLKVLKYLNFICLNCYFCH